MAESLLEVFAKELLQDIASEATLEGSEQLLPEAFTRIGIELLADLGSWADGQVCYHRARGVEVSGWGWDPEAGTLDLCVTSFTSSGKPDRLPKADGEALVKRLRNFFTQSVGTLYEKIEESSPQFDLAWFVHSNRPQINRVRLSVLSNQITNLESMPKAEELDGLACQLEVWDLERLERLFSSGRDREPIVVDFAGQFGAGLPCLEADNDDPNLRSFLLVIPGAVLADLYLEHGARLLELNVRSFLQARGKVNRGIRETLHNEPGRFFSYNNGISATASDVEIESTSRGLILKSMSDVQIVNGGQTTASIANVVAKDKGDVTHVAVQAKLTVVPEERISEIVPLISRFANSQNAVSNSDLSANHPYHVQMEKLSRTIWAPSVEGGIRETRWFYERARGQYNDMLGKQGTPARKRVFKEAHPTAQKFTKTDLAKFEMTWLQKPHLVSRGAQKCFIEFMLDIDKNVSKQNPDLVAFEQMCAKALIFRTAEKIVHRQKFGGYRANIVAYTLAQLIAATEMRLDLDAIWKRQTIGPILEAEIERICVQTHDFLINAPGGANVTEFAKREACWKSFKDLDLGIADLSSECIPSRSERASREGEPAGAIASSEDDVEWAVGVPADVWFSIAEWARASDQLDGNQRAAAFSIGRMVKDGKRPKPKQARNGRLLHGEAVSLGWTRD